jgi:conjugal transfer pilus assembly protein TraV
MRIAITVLISTFLAGCASTMSGLDGESKFSCKAPDGVTCASLSGVYANAVANNLPALRKGENGVGVNQGALPAKSGGIIGRTPSSGDPIRTQPKVLRVWIAPWEDADGDLHDQSYVYVVADTGRWVIEHNQKRIVDRYRPTVIRPAQANPSEQKTAPQAQQQTGSGVVLPGAQGYSPVVPQQPSTGEQE